MSDTTLRSDLLVLRADCTWSDGPLRDGLDTLIAKYCPSETRPRIVLDPHGFMVRAAIRVYWRLWESNGYILPCDAEGHPLTLECDLFRTPERLALWLKIASHPTEEVPNDR